MITEPTPSRTTKLYVIATVIAVAMASSLALFWILGSWLMVVIAPYNMKRRTLFIVAVCVTLWYVFLFLVFGVIRIPSGSEQPITIP